MDASLLLQQLKQLKPLQVVPVLSPSSSAPSSSCSASPPAKREHSPNSPEETKPKKCRPSPLEELTPDIQALLANRTLIPKTAVKSETVDDEDSRNEAINSLLVLGRSSSPASEEHIFCQVPGRLAILNANTKYPVTVGEIKRRLGNPERLNTSVMGGILRRAKAKNGGKELRELLEGMGLDLPMGKRKAIAMTLFTPMVEGEAIHLAKDFDTLCTNEFPIEAVADHLSEKAQGDKEKRQKLEIASQMLKELKATLQMDRSPVMAEKRGTELPERLQELLTHFSMCTHGFGTPAIIAAMTVVINILDVCVTKMNETEKSAVQWHTFFQLAAIMSQQAAQNKPA